MTYATEEERIAARRATWVRYNSLHREERRAHNKLHVQKEHVKARRHEKYLERRANLRQNQQNENNEAISHSPIIMLDSIEVRSPTT